MDPIDIAIADMKSHEAGPDYPYTKYATKHGVGPSTLWRRATGHTQPRATAHEGEKNLSTPQQQELVRYITHLTKAEVPPTRQMIRSHAANIAGHAVSESWATRFLHNHHNELTSRWTALLD